MVDPVGTPLAALATAEQCVKFAATLRKKYSAYVTAERSLQELILQLEHRAVTIEHQVAFLRSIWTALEGRLQNLQNTLLHMLYHKLQYAIELVDAAVGSKQEDPTIHSVQTKRGTIRRLYFAFSLKQCLQKTVDELEKWHKMFDPTWYLICRISTPVVDASCQSHLEARPVSVLKELRSAANQHQIQDAQPHTLLDMTILTHAPARSDLGFGIQWAHLRSGDHVIIDQFIPHERASLQRTLDEVSRLSSTLAKVEPQIFGLLQCQGVVFRAPELSSEALPVYNLLFNIPPGMIKPATLRARLGRAQSVSLNVRLSLAQRLSNAVMFVHTSQFVHKNIRPETILTFESSTSKQPMPFLVGFEKIRLASGETFKVGDSRWESNLYRHPKRQGLWPEEEYNMLHDVYSLGVVLLEVGLWTNFVPYDHLGSVNENSTGTNTSRNRIVEFTIPADATPALGPMLAPLMAAHVGKSAAERALLTKTFLTRLARKQLPCTMGDKYAEIVMRCLTCLDTENPGLGDPSKFLDKDDIVVGVEFVESVIMALHEISY